jgi:spore maturation protein CgeB
LIVQVKGRDFEVPMAGGFLLTKDSDQIREFFKPGKEIVVYKDFNDLIDKAKYYVKHDDKREKIAESGHKRAKKDHTYTKRLTQLLKDIQ